MVPPIFRYLQQTGDVSDRDMFRTFNMGIGMVLVCAPANVDDVQARISEAGESSTVIIGRVTDGDGQVEYA